MDRFINNLRVLWRTERAIADIKLRHALARSGLNVAAAVLALIALLMFEVAAFFALRDLWSTTHSGAGSRGRKSRDCRNIVADRRSKKAGTRTRPRQRDSSPHDGCAAGRCAASAGGYRVCWTGAKTSPRQRAAADRAARDHSYECVEEEDRAEIGSLPEAALRKQSWAISRFWARGIPCSARSRRSRASRRHRRRASSRS